MMMNLSSTIAKVGLHVLQDARFKIIPFAGLLDHIFIKMLEILPTTRYLITRLIKYVYNATKLKYEFLES